MDNSKRETYEKWIDRLRQFVAYGILVSFVGFFFPDDSYPRAITLFVVITFFILGIALFFEYLIRVLLFRPGRKLPWYQFSLSGMLILTACVAAVCAWLKILGPLGILWLFIGLLFFACGLEGWLKKKQ
jgi:hypothetical protein